MIKKGSKVKTKIGDGKVIRVDTKTYSIPLYIVKITGGEHKGETIATSNILLKR